MDTEILIAHGNQAREDNNPEQALAYYAQAFVQDRNNFNAFNNYGNVLREVGDPAGAIPFLQRAIQLNPTNPYPMLFWTPVHSIQPFGFVSWC